MIEDPMAVAKAQAILDGGARGSDCADVARAHLELHRFLVRGYSAALLKALEEHAVMRVTLTATQARCTQLLEENRRLRAGGEVRGADGIVGVRGGPAGIELTPRPAMPPQVSATVHEVGDIDDSDGDEVSGALLVVDDAESLRALGGLLGDRVVITSAPEAP